MTQERKSLPTDPSEITTDQQRRKIFLRYVNRAWLILGIVTLVTLPIFPQQHSEFIYLIGLIFPTYLIIRFLNISGKTKLAAVVFTLALNFGFYGLFILLVGELGAYQAFETQATVWFLLGLAILFAGALVDKRAAPALAAANSILLIVTRLIVAPNSDPRPSILVFWWMMALTIWLYEGTLHEALRISWVEVAERKQANKTVQDAELKYRMLVERLPVVVYTSELGVNGRWHYIGPQIEQLLGFTAEEWMADPGLWYQQVHPDDRNHQQELEEWAWAQKESFEGEYRILTRDGRFIWVRDSAQIVAPQDNNAPIVQGVLMDITERRQTEQELHVSEERYRTLAEAAQDMISVLDHKGQITYTNRFAAEQFGKLPQDLIEKNIAEIFPAEIAERQQANLQKVIQSGEALYMEAPNAFLGKTKWLGTWLSPIKDKSGKTDSILIISRDITERRQVEEALYKSESLLKESQIVANLGSYVLDISSGTWKSSDVLNKIMGIDDQFERTIDSWAALIHTDDRKMMVDYFTKEVLKERGRFDRQYRIVRNNDLAERWVHGLGNLEINSDNQVIKMIGTIQDITEYKLAEESTQTMNILLEQTLEQSPIPMVLVSMPDGIIRSANTACRRFLGMDKDPSPVGTLLEELDISWQDLDMQGNPGTYEELPLPRSLMGLKTDPQERRIIRQDGTSVYGLVYGSPIFDTAGRLIAGYLVMIDITERKWMEDNLRKSEERFKSQSQAAFEGIMIHDRGMILDANQKMADLFGFQSPDELIGKNGFEILPMTEQSRNDIRSSLGKDLESVIEIEVIKRDGSTFPAETQGRNIDFMGHNARVVAMHDITERKQAEQAINQKLAEQNILHQTSQALLSIHLNPEAIYSTLHQAVAKMMPCEAFNIVLNDKSGGDYHAVYLYDKDHHYPSQRIPLGEGLSGRVISKGETLFIHDNEQSKMPAFHYGISQSVRSILAVPLRTDNETVGMISAQSYQAHVFKEGHRVLLETLAAQFTTVIENARLFNETTQRAQEFASLYETSTALSAENNLTSLLQVIVSHAATLLNASNGAMYLYNESDQDLETVVATTSDIPIGTHLNLGEGVAGRVAQTKLPMRIEDYSTWEGRSLKYEGHVFRAILEVPMLFGGKLIGVLTTTEMDKSKRKYTEVDERLLSLFAAQAAGAIHSTKLRNETAQRAREFASLYETSKALSAENELNSMLQAIVEHAKKLLGSASSGMYLFISETNELEMTVDTSPYIAFGTRLQLNEGVAGRVAQTKLPLRIDDYSTWEGRSPAFDGVSLGAVLEVPMLYGGNLIGVLTADEVGGSTRKFTEADERMLSLFASQAAGAIHSARLLEETRRRAEEFAVLYQTTHDLSVQQSLSAVLKIIVQQATTLLNVPNASIHLYDSANAEMELVATFGPDLPLGSRRKVNPDVPTHAPIIVDDYQLWEHHSALYDAIPYKALMAVPLLYGGNLLGILDVSDLAPSTRTFNEEDLHLLSLFAGQAASAIANARLFEETAHQLDQLKALHTIDRAISSSFDLRPILNTVITQTLSQLSVDAADVLLFHPHLQTLEYIAGQGFYTRAIEETQLRLGEGHAGRTAFERRTIHIPNLHEAGSNFARASLLAGEGFLEYYGVPLIAKGEVKGVLEIFHRSALPSNPEWLDFLETLAGQAAITIDQTQLFDDLQHANLELIIAYDATIEGWSHAMDLRDKETEGHTLRVTELTMALAKAMGINKKEMLHIKRGALLHDIGKMGIPDRILLKDGKLTAKEWVIMRQHPTFSYEMLKPIKYLQQSLDIPYCHHEKWDGSGYPRGLQSEEIPLVARIFAVVDVWDAVTIDRPYRKAWTKQKALKYIREQSGKHFDPKVVKTFLELIGKKSSTLSHKSTQSN